MKRRKRLAPEKEFARFTPMRQLVALIMQRARGQATLEALLEKMRPHLAKKDYKQNAASRWMRGTSPPPADVFLAAVKVGEVSVDEFLYGDSLLVRLERAEARLDRLERSRDGQVSPRSS